MKSRLGIVLTTAAALGSAAFLIAGADAQQGPAPAPQPPASEAQPMPPPASGPQEGRRGGSTARFSAEDRAAFFDAHIAAVKAGLQLTPDQEKLWGPVEQAVRDLAKDMIALRQKIAQEGRPADPVERLQRAADAATTRGEDLHKVAAAAQPLWASLSQDQKRRLPMLMHGMRRAQGQQAWAGMYHRYGMQPQNGWRERMHDMMQRFAPRGDDDDSRGR